MYLINPKSAQYTVPSSRNFLKIPLRKNYKEAAGTFSGQQREPCIQPKHSQKSPSTINDVLTVVTKDKSDKEFKKVKEDKLNVEHPKSISVGNGNVG